MADRRTSIFKARGWRARVVESQSVRVVSLPRTCSRCSAERGWLLFFMGQVSTAPADKRNCNSLCWTYNFRAAGRRARGGTPAGRPKQAASPVDESNKVSAWVSPICCQCSSIAFTRFYDVQLEACASSKLRWPRQAALSATGQNAARRSTRRDAFSLLSLALRSACPGCPSARHRQCYSTTILSIPPIQYIPEC